VRYACSIMFTKMVTVFISGISFSDGSTQNVGINRQTQFVVVRVNLRYHGLFN
jgi:hypothetical protein